MFELIGQHLQEAARRKAQTAAIGLGAAIAMAVGMGFLTAAAWLYLVSVTTPLSAALILGGMFFGIGLMTLAMLSDRRRSHARNRAAKAAERSAVSGDDGDLTRLVMVFLAGIKAGQKARS